MPENPFFSNLFEKRRTIETLTEESRADSDFYLFLGFSGFITTLGFLLDNPVVVIGAMLVAPLLFPIMSFGMGVVTTSWEAIRRALWILAQSITLVVSIAFLTTVLFPLEHASEQLQLASDPNTVFFLVAFFSGIVASFSWVKQQHDQTLPGVAVTVSLIPPLAAIGVAIALFSKEIFIGSVKLFLINLGGIATASTIVFYLFGFQQLRRFQEEKIAEEVKLKEENNADTS